MTPDAMREVEIDWDDIGSVCKLFGSERSSLDQMFASRVKPGRNFWKEAADEIERLRALSAKTDRDVVIKAASQITANDRECAAHLLDDLEEYQVNELASKIETVARWFRKMRVAGVRTALKSPQQEGPKP